MTMKRTARHLFRCSLVGTLTVLIGFSPAYAGRFLRNACCCVPSPPCCPPVSFATVSMTGGCCPSPMISSPIIAAPLMNDCCGCGAISGGVVRGGVLSSGIVASGIVSYDSLSCSAPISCNSYAAPLTSFGEILYDGNVTYGAVDNGCVCDYGSVDMSGGVIVDSFAPMMGESIVDGGVVVGGGVIAGNVIHDESSVVGGEKSDPPVSSPPADTESSPSDSPFSNPSSSDSVSSDKPADNSKKPADPKPEPPAKTPEPPAKTPEPPAKAPEPPAKTPEPPAKTPEPEAPDNIFDNPPAEAPPVETPPAETPPANSSGVDDLFGGSDAPAATEESSAKPPMTDDLFGGATTETPPAEAPPTTPDAAPVDDLFGDSAPAAEAAPPATEPAPPAADSGLGDLFGDSPAAEAPAAEAPAATPPAESGGVDDLFGTPPTDPAPADAAPADDAPKSDSIDDLFGKPAEEPKTESTSIDDLFGAVSAPQEYVAELPAPLVEDQMVKNASEQRLVVKEKALVAVDTLSQTRLRTWIDNTGSFRTEGRLIEINSDSIRLIKDNGKKCTVPKSRLCEADAAYVESVAEKLEASKATTLISR